MMIAKKHRREAFTLIELIIYVAISSMMVSVMLLFGVQMLELRSETEYAREVNQNARFVMNLISREIRDADSVNTVSATSLTLNTDEGGTIVIDTDTKTVGTQTVMFVQVDGTQITSDLVTLNFIGFTDLTVGSETPNVQFQLGFESLDGVESILLRSAASLRE